MTRLGAFCLIRSATSLSCLGFIKENRKPSAHAFASLWITLSITSSIGDIFSISLNIFLVSLLLIILKILMNYKIYKLKLEKH